MLFIGDIHITTKYTDKIITAIKSYIADFPDEQNLIFLGDYMYMFSYDRKALGALFDLFIELRHEGKNLYILAGNHDRIGTQFVYAEGKKISDLLAPLAKNKLSFITEPELHMIEGKQLLFFPFNKTLSFEGHSTTQPAKWAPSVLEATIHQLLSSENSNEQVSGRINALLKHYTDQHKDLTVVHHYYIAQTKFPQQQTQFSYKDIALSPAFLDMDHIQLISGHIHTPFSYKNYTCMGSVRYTSPLEQDHYKYLFHRDTKRNTIEGKQMVINPYVSISADDQGAITSSLIQQRQAEIDEFSHEAFQGGQNVALTGAAPSLAATNLVIKTDTLNYDTLENNLEPHLLESLSSRTLKKKDTSSLNISFTLDMAQKNLQSSIIDRKIIVKDFIMSRFPNEFEKYRTLLDEMHLL